MYATRTDIELVYGSENVRRWADANNTDDAQNVAARIEWALSLADSRINDELSGGVYEVPFSSPYPLGIVDCASRIAGILLYETRGLRDADPEKDICAPHRKYVKDWLKRVKLGASRLHGVSEVSQRFPAVIED